MERQTVGERIETERDSENEGLEAESRKQRGMRGCESGGIREGKTQRQNEWQRMS